MLKLLQKILTQKPSQQDGPAGNDRIQVATCVLLLEMAHTDGDLHEVEELLVKDLVQQRFDLSASATAELLELSRQQRQESLDLYQFTMIIHKHFSLDEKLEVMESLWRVVYADGVLDKYEEHLMRQLTTLLRLSHRQMIDVKLKVLAESGKG